MMNNKSFIAISFFTLLNFVIINYSVSFLDYKLPDSNSYINFSPKYKSLYPFLINFVDTFEFKFDLCTNASFIF